MHGENKELPPKTEQAFLKSGHIQTSNKQKSRHKFGYIFVLSLLLGIASLVILTFGGNGEADDSPEGKASVEAFHASGEDCDHADGAEDVA